MYQSTKTRGARRSARLITSFTAAAATIVALLVVAPAANASETAAVPAPAPVAISAAEQANIDALLAASDNSGDVAVFDINQAIKLGADQDATQQYASAWVESGGTIVGTSGLESADIAKGTEASAMALAACRGRTGFTGYYWFGPQTALNSCLTQTFINAIGVAAAGGGTYAAISALTVAGLPAAAVVGVVAAVLALGIAFLNICKDTSSIGAIYLNGGIPGVVPPSCWAQ